MPGLRNFIRFVVLFNLQVEQPLALRVGKDLAVHGKVYNSRRNLSSILISYNAALRAIPIMTKQKPIFLTIGSMTRQGLHSDIFGRIVPSISIRRSTSLLC